MGKWERTDCRGGGGICRARTGLVGVQVVGDGVGGCRGRGRCSGRETRHPLFCWGGGGGPHGTGAVGTHGGCAERDGLCPALGVRRLRRRELNPLIRRLRVVQVVPLGGRGGAMHLAVSDICCRLTCTAHSHPSFMHPPPPRGMRLMQGPWSRGGGGTKGPSPPSPPPPPPLPHPTHHLRDLYQCPTSGAALKHVQVPVRARDREGACPSRSPLPRNPVPAVMRCPGAPRRYPRPPPRLRKGVGCLWPLP